MNTQILDTAERKYGSIEDWNLKSNNYWDKRWVFVLKHHNPSGSVEGRGYPNVYSYKLEDRIFDKNAKDKEGKPKPMSRIIRVVNGATSIFKDEQTEDEQKLEPIRKEFSNRGDLVVEGTEGLVLDYLLKCNKNETNPERDKNVVPLFGLLDLKQGLKQDMEKDKSDAKAASWCYDAEFKHIKRYARVLGVDITKDPEEVRMTMRHLARHDSKRFNEGLNNELTQRKFYVLESSERGYIRIDLQSNSLYWDNNNLITNSPVGKHPVDHFVDLSKSNTDMNLAYLTIQRKVDEEDNYGKEPIASAVVAADSSSTTIDVNTDLEKLIDVAIGLGVILNQKPWFIFADKKYMGKHKFIDAISKDALLKQAILDVCTNK